MLTNLFSFPIFGQTRVVIWCDKGFILESDNTAFFHRPSGKSIPIADGYDLTSTHAPIVEFYTDIHKRINVCENVFTWMQGECWSRNGEARSLIESIEGVNHTSMKIGDMVQFGDELFLLSNDGFIEIGSLVDGQFKPLDEKGE